MLEKGKRTKATKRHILDDDADLRSHMPCEGKVLTFNIGGVKHFSGKWSSTGRDARRKTLARRCMSEKCQSRIKHRASGAQRKPCFLADLTTDVPHRPQLDILHPLTYLQEGQEPKKVAARAPCWRLQEKSPLPFMRERQPRPTVLLFHRLPRLLCWCLWGSKM